jgi:hypothetical protein
MGDASTSWFHWPNGKHQPTQKQSEERAALFCGRLNALVGQTLERNNFILFMDGLFDFF